MIGGMEGGVDAQSLISISLMKIHNSRTQRGGIKLHKNLLVSYVLRNARQVYIKEKYAEIYRMQQYEEVMTVCNEIQELNPLDLDAEEADEEERSRGEESSVCGAALQRGAAQPAALCRTGSAVSGCCPLEDVGKDPEPSYYRSCCMEAPPAAPCDPFTGSGGGAHCNKTTVLDLDTHVVTTVENGFLHQDCCCAPTGQSAAKKRKVEFGCCVSDLDEVPDFTRKRAKREDCSFSDYTDTSNISNLISIFGSGFSGLLSRQADLEQICSKQALASLGAWTRAIVAF
ncbi:immediate early response gene 5-like protein [Amphiprion ocellaris]|uniref:Immediate early response 5 like n=2 Tax=Amphiprion TaxID=80969 RepID=A0A3Q1BR89_AMPOC|nr:immediate early response gene 5-like protein [Amphiprion ocellaris]